MPKPLKNERRKKFIKRCIPHLFKEEPHILTSVDKKNKQAYAICNSIYDKEKKTDRKIKKFENFHYKNDQFKAGDIVMISHTTRSVIFNKEIGEIKFIDDQVMSIEFKRSIYDISNGNVIGHSGVKDNCKNGHGWNFYTIEPDILPYNPDPYQDWEEWNENINENDEFQVGDKIIVIKCSVIPDFNNETGEIKYIDDDIVSIDFVQPVHVITKSTFVGHYGYKENCKGGHGYNFLLDVIIMKKYNFDPYEDWIEWEDDWIEDVNEEYNHGEDILQVDDRVIINDDSVYKDQGYGKNGVRLVGVIIDVKRYKEFEYRVQWENDTRNSYNRGDLILYNSDPYEDWIEWEEDDN